MRGRTPDNSNVHQLAGAIGKRRAKVQSIATPLMDLKPPARLKGVARQTWKRLAPQLLEDQLLSELSAGHFTAYCDAVGLYERMSEIVDELIAKKAPLTADTPNGSRQQIPELGMKNRALEQMLKLGEIFAIDPYSRERRGKHVPARTADARAGSDLLTKSLSG